MRRSPILKALHAVGLSVAVVGLLYPVASSAPAILTPQFAASGDRWYLVFALQAVLALCIARVLRVPVARLLATPVSADGLRAVFWLLLGGAWLGVLVSLGSVATDVHAPGSAADVPVGEFAWSGDLGSAARDFVLNPTLEELVFRACVLGLLLRALPAWAALLLSSTLFGVLHPTPVALAVGMAFGLLYLRYASLLLCIVAHALWNFLVAFAEPVAVSLLHESALLPGIGGSVRMVQLTCLVTALGCFWVFLRVIGEKRGESISSTFQPQ